MTGHQDQLTSNTHDQHNYTLFIENQNNETTTTCTTSDTFQTSNSIINDSNSYNLKGNIFFTVII